MDLRIKYLDLRIATLICRDYQFLIGKFFQQSESERGIIRNVVVAPYSKILKWQYVCELLGNPRLEKPLDIVNNAKFDVIAISDKFVQHMSALYVKDIRSYLKEHNIPFDISAYLGGRCGDISSIRGILQ